MRIWKWTKLEFALSHSVLRFLLIFLAITAGVGLLKTDVPGGWLSLYMIFGGMVVISTPFTAQTNFVDILPTKTYERVFGRFLFGALLITVAALGGFAVQMAETGIRGGAGQTATAIGAAGQTAMGIGAAAKSALALTCLFTGIAFFIMALEYLVFYCFTIRNVQIMSLLRIVPGFVFFFGFTSLMENLQKELQEAPQSAPAWILWPLNHLPEMGALALLVGLLVLVCCAIAASAHERRRLV